MTEQEKRVIDAAGETDGKKTIACAQAFKFSSESGIPVREIGEICNRNNIKIKACQLGCFK
jgi:alanyl-tRNA synthetase